MRDRSELSALAEKVAGRMRDMRNESLQEGYPIGLIDMNLWEWPQGVGIYGLFKLYRCHRDAALLDFLEGWYEARISEGLPERNVNTTAPMLGLLELYELAGREEHRALCADWASWIMEGMLRTGDGAFQHMITGDPNDGQILIDTLFMTCLFLARAGRVFDRPAYVEEAKRQFRIHVRRLFDRSRNLFYHGWDFGSGSHYGAVHWARGNSWYTCGLVDFLDIVELEPDLRADLLDVYKAQVEALRGLQDRSGLWRTILDDPSSYLETSASAAFGYGILKGVRAGYLDEGYLETGANALEAVISRIDAEGTVLGVSYGTPVGMDAQFYKDIPICPMTYGQALALLLLLEALEW